MTKKKRQQRTPSPKVIKAVELTIENSKVDPKDAKSQGRIMQEAGYGARTQLSPQKVTQSESFLALLHKHMPQEKYAEAQNQLAEASELKYMDFPLKKGAKLEHEKTIIKDMLNAQAGAHCHRVSKITQYGGAIVLRAYYTAPDHRHRAKALDMYNKITGGYAPIQTENKNINISLADLRKIHENENDE